MAEIVRERHAQRGADAIRSAMLSADPASCSNPGNDRFRQAQGETLSMLGPMASAAWLPPKRITSAPKWIPFFEPEPGRNGAFVKHLGATGRSVSAITGSSVTMIARAVEGLP